MDVHIDDHLTNEIAVPQWVCFKVIDGQCFERYSIEPFHINSTCYIDVDGLTDRHCYVAKMFYVGDLIRGHDRIKSMFIQQLWSVNLQCWIKMS